jgi:aryl-alcohol dehydrogenase-like predicted oxidoreductase
MQYRRIGKWGVKVSEVSLGSWLTHGGSVDEKNSINRFNMPLARYNFFDNANVYAQGA